MERFTLLIPTRERDEALIHTLKSVVATTYENCEFIVSDNYGSGSTQDIVSSFNDQRLKYIRTPKRLSMAGNYEFALCHCKDGWVSILGDDDGLLPNAITNMMNLAQEYKVEAISSNMIHFQWGNEANNQSGRFLVPKNEKNEIRNAKDILNTLLMGTSAFGSDYAQLPWLYHGGAAKKDLIDKCRCLRTGRFFNASVPDVYSAIALGRSVDRYLRIGEPNIISGTSKFSIGTAQMKLVAAKSSRDPFQLFLEEADIEFSKNFILGKSLMAIFYDCFEKSEFLGGINEQLDIEDKVRIMIKLSGKNLLTVLREAKQTFALNSILAFMPYLLGVTDWTIYNFNKHLLARNIHKRNIVIPPRTYNIVDAVDYIVKNTKSNEPGSYLI